MMLHRSNSVTPISSTPILASEAAGGFDFSGLLEIFTRQWFIISVFALLAVAGATAYLLSARSVYLANAYLLLDTRRMQLFQQQALIPDASFDAPAVESQMEVIRSETLATSVVEDLGLADDPEFTARPMGFFGTVASSILQRFGRGMADRLLGQSANSPDERTRAAVSHFRENIRIQRVRMTYVLEIGFSSVDPGKAARVANAVAEAYILDQTQSKQYTTRRATNWLQERMNELREQAVTAEREVQDFRIKNNLVKIGSGLLGDQQITELTAQLSKAREQTSEAKSRLDRLKEIMSSHIPDASMTAWLQNDVINRLRQQYVDAARREAALNIRLGPLHEAVVNARKEMTQIEGSANAELRRILSTYEAEYDSALEREREVKVKLEKENTQFSGSRQEQGVLQILESVSKTYQTLHDTFLQRYIETTTQQNFTTTEARVITAASSGRKIYPNPQQVFMLSTVLGLLVGGGAAYMRERLNRVFRTSKQVEQALGVECLGILPALESKKPLKATLEPVSPGDRTIRADLGIARQVVLTPFSRFTETVRSIKVAVDTGSNEVKVVGLVSALPGEGKSTLAANVAQLAAHSGHRTLLIDADLRAPSLSGLLAPQSKVGLLQVLAGTNKLTDAIWRDSVTGLHFLPVVLDTPFAHTNEILASEKMAHLLQEARKVYDYIILDFPPLAPVVDAKAASHLIDGFVLIIEWGQTSQEAVTETLAAAEVVQSRLIGSVLNKANPSALKRIESYKGQKYHRYYSANAAA